MQMQRTILWVIFSISLFLLWDAWLRHTGGPGMLGPTGTTPTSEVAGAGDGTTSAGSAATQGVPSAGGAASADGSIPDAGTTAQNAAQPTAPGVPGASAVPAASGAAAPSAQSVSLRNDLLAVDVSTSGAVINRTELLKHRNRVTDANVVLFSTRPDEFFVAQSGVINAPTGAGFPTHRSEFSVTENAESSVTLTSESGGLTLRREYALQPGSYSIQITDTLTNNSGEAVTPIIYRQLTRGTHIPAGDDSFYNTSFVGPVVYTDEQKFQKVDFDDIADGDAEHAKVSSDGWVGMMQHYFSTALIPADNVRREYYTLKAGNGLYSVGIKQPLAQLAPGQTVSDTARLFAGPQEHSILQATAPGLDLMVDYGFLTIICQPLWWLLDTLHGFVGNWGWAIVLLTLIIKTIFFPLQAASYKSMARMKAVGPRLQQLRERFGDDRVKLNQAMMDLYKTEKINPIGGCLPILVQIPVFIALYWVLLASVEMRDAPWILWVQDLASPDPYYILPLLMAASMFVQVRLNPTPPDPIQAKVMMAMPIVFSVMFFFFPSGLVLYWLVNNLYSIAQQWVITRKIVGPTT